MLTKIAPDDLHDAVLEWFAFQGLPVHHTHYQFDRSYYAWRHHGDKQSLTLWVSQVAHEDYGTSAIVDMLKQADPRSLLARYRHAHLHVRTTDTALAVYSADHYAP
jgi:hypothetical protein